MNYEMVDELLEEYGEVILVMDSGEMYELHDGDVHRDDQNELFSWEAPQTEYIIDGNKVESVELPKSHKL